MNSKQWNNPITAELLAKETTTLEAVRVDENSRQIYGLLRDSNGRGQIVRFNHATDDASDMTEYLTDINLDVGSKAHGYGGGALAITRQGHLLFSDALKDGVHYLNTHTHCIDTVIQPNGSSHFADFDQHPRAENLFVAIKEDAQSNQTTIALLDTHSQSDITLLSGADFYAHPRFNPPGDRVCWIQWNHPDMPWTDSELHVAEFVQGHLRNDQVIRQHRGISQPRWGLDSSLFFVSDELPFCQLSQIAPDTPSVMPIQIPGLENTEMAGAEFKLGRYLSSTVVLIASVIRDAVSSVVSIDVSRNQYFDLQLPLVDISYDAMRRISPIEFAIIGATQTQSPALFIVTLQPSLQTVASMREIYLTFDGSQIPLDWLSFPSGFSFPRVHGASRGGYAHGFFMAPPKLFHENQNPKSQPDRLPCVIVVHGGPTRHHRPSVNWEWQYLTSRGFAVVLLNHQGSTGYGKSHRDALTGRWGEADVDDVASCVTFLTETEQLVDPQRIGITGISAGGYCTLQSMCLYPHLLCSGISVAGISDMQKFARETHKFESHYDQLLIFGVSSNTVTKKSPHIAKAEDTTEMRYKRVSPIYQVHRLLGPVLLLQGMEDSVVLPNQATLFAEAVKKSASPNSSTNLVMYPDEGHGFHLASTIQDSLECQLRWWQETLSLK